MCGLCKPIALFAITFFANVISLTNIFVQSPNWIVVNFPYDPITFYVSYGFCKNNNADPMNGIPTE